MKFFSFFWIVLVFFSCKKAPSEVVKTVITKDAVVFIQPKKDSVQPISALEKRLIAANLVNIQDLDSTIVVDLKYSTTDNFVGIDLYGALENAYLQPDVAQKIIKAQSFLKQLDSTKTLLIYDAVRPKSVQQKMWDTLKMPFQEKIKFLSNPKNHSIHNYGAAVDISIADQNGTAIDMGTPYDYLGVLAYPTKEQLLLKQGKLTVQQVANRKLLRKVMKQAGFFNIQTEWWHFNSCRKSVAKQQYKLVE